MSLIEKAISKKAAQADSSTTSCVTPQDIEQSSLPELAVAVSSQQQLATEQQFTSKASVELDLARLERLNFVALTTKRRAINDEFRVIKRKVLSNAFGNLSQTLNRPNLIMVCSSRPGEGKTFTAVNLALSLALEKDKTVLLVDADVLRPSVAKTLDFKYQYGLTEYLSSDTLQVEDILLSTNVDKLKLIAAGKPHHLSTELLASEKMLKLVDEFATRYPDRIVIFDAPPLLGVNETAILAAMCGQALLVVEENNSKLAEIEQAVALLPEELAVGFLINKAYRTRGKEYGYGYYYGQS